MFFLKKNFIRCGNVKVLVRVQDKELKINTSGTNAQVEMQISELLVCRILFSLSSNVILLVLVSRMIKRPALQNVFV
jgi:hypothetical protein